MGCNGVYEMRNNEARYQISKFISRTADQRLKVELFKKKQYKA